MVSTVSYCMSVRCLSVYHALILFVLTQIEGRCGGKEGQEEESDNPSSRDGGRVPESRGSVTLQLSSKQYRDFE